MAKPIINYQNGEPNKHDQCCLCPSCLKVVSDAFTNERDGLKAELHDCRDAMARLKSGADSLRAQLAIEKDRVIKQTLHAADLRAETATLGNTLQAASDRIEALKAELEAAKDGRESLAQVTRETLKVRNLWAPENPADLPTATAQAIDALKSRLASVEGALDQAVKVIRQWHGEPAWEIYLKNAPEMAPIRAALKGGGK